METHYIDGPENIVSKYHKTEPQKDGKLWQKQSG